MENNLLNNEALVNEIASIITNARNNVAKQVNNELLNAYWNIGRVIVEDELKNNRGEYGKNNYLLFQKILLINLEKVFHNLIYITRKCSIRNIQFSSQ